MNQAMQSFLLKTICCILIINVTFCSSCFRSVCKASCYFKHSGFDFGYCKKGQCMCAPPVIYVFDGIGRVLSDKNNIDNSLINNNVIQNLIPISRPSAVSDASGENKKNKIWKDIVYEISIKNPFIKEDNLKDLKAKIFSDLTDLNTFAKDLQNSLETALIEMKKKNPSSSKECNDLLNILLQQQKKNGAQNFNSKNTIIINGAPNLPPLQATTSTTQASLKIVPTTQASLKIAPITQATPQIASTPQIAPATQSAPMPQVTPKTVNKLTASLPRNVVPNQNKITNTLPANSMKGAKSNKQKISNKLQPKLKSKQTQNQEDNSNDGIVFQLLDETYEEYDSTEQSDVSIKQNRKSQTSNNKKAGKNLPDPVKKEKLEGDSSYYESQSGSESYYESSEEDNAKEVVNTVPQINN